MVIVRVDASFSEITGCSKDEIIGKKLDFLFGSSPDLVVLNGIQRAVSSGRAYRGDLLCHRKDGKSVWCTLVLSPTESPGRPQDFFSGALIDITAQKLQEEHLKARETTFRSIFENAVEGIYQSTPDGNYIEVNPALARMYGYESPTDLLGQVHDIQQEIYVDPGMRERFKAEIEKADVVRGLEYQVRRRDGRIIWISENARAVRDAEGRVRYYEGFIEEITARKQAEAALRRSQDALIETSRQVGMAEVATGILHNMGNALNSINVSTTVMISKIRESRANGVVKAAALMELHAATLGTFITTDPKGQHLPKYLAQLGERLLHEQAEFHEELKGLKKTLEHVNAIVSMQQNYAKASDVAEEIDSIALVEDALRLSAGSLARHEVQVIREYAPDLPKVIVPKHVVLQILVNLIRNAQKACDAAASHPKLLLLRLRTSCGGRFMRMEIADNGVGIPQENLTRIFNHGFTTREDGHGFGLHSGALMAKQLGGSLTATSDGVGKGASFVLEFPSANAGSA